MLRRDRLRKLVLAGHFAAAEGEECYRKRRRKKFAIGRRNPLAPPPTHIINISRFVTVVFSTVWCRHISRCRVPVLDFRHAVLTTTCIDDAKDVLRSLL